MTCLWDKHFQRKPLSTSRKVSDKVTELNENVDTVKNKFLGIILYLVIFFHNIHGNYPLMPFRHFIREDFNVNLHVIVK